jgi:DNA modification methylase
VNLLYYGDNLDVLRQHVKDESVDLVYLDPPFNSQQDYNVLFSEHGTKAAAQIKAFEDTWQWDESAALTFAETVEQGGGVSQVLQAFQTFLGNSDMLAYLAMMAPRLVELRRVMKPTASIYLHCDPAASHYLKMLMDAVFGPHNFLNEIVWKRTSAHSSAKRYGPVHDVILFYARGSSYRWNGVRLAHDPEYVASFFKNTEPGTGRLFQANVLTGAGTRDGESGKPWRGYDPTAHGRHWALPSKMLEQLGVSGGSMEERLEALDAGGRVAWPKKKGGQPRLKYYADELEAAGAAAPDLWTDIPHISGKTGERLGYPTQKPLALLERILQASSNEGDIVLDPFCGCGTTVAAAQALKRPWIGIDITHLAIGLIKHRLRDAYGPGVMKTYQVIGEPTDIGGAKQLAEDNKYQFQWWALSLVHARPADEKKGADKGIDGRIYFHDEGASGKAKQIILSVKGGQLKATDVRDLRGVIEREKAALGVLISLEEPTAKMRAEAASAEFYTSPWDKGKYPRLQLRTVEELLGGKGIEYPAKMQTNVTHKKAPKAKAIQKKQLSLGSDGPDEEDE